jgi:phenylalanyl-tRNA synthetase beta chain
MAEKQQKGGKMPIIEISAIDLKRLVGKLDFEEIEKYSKLEISESENSDILNVEVKDSNRPDLLSTEGIARELKGILGKERGLVKYETKNSNFILNNEGVKARPEIACAVIKNIKLDDFAIKQIIQLQEKLCDGFGRKRKEAAIGVYDFDKIKWPVIYKSVKPDGIKFTPLDMAEALTPRQILIKHEKGREYAKLLENESEYPLVIDSANEVLSMPPIINSNYSGKVSGQTKNLFVEVTGFDKDKIMMALNIILAALADRKGEVYSVSVNAKNKFVSPEFKTKIKKFSVDDVNKRLGLSLTGKEISNLIERARYNAKMKGNEIEAEVPFYRADILHPVDVIEDIAIAYGYENISPEDMKIFTTGKTLDETKTANKIADIMIGLGFQELVTLNFSNKNDLFKKMNQKETEVIEIENPVSLSYSCLRNWLIPSLMNVLSQNTTKTYSQQIFEVGNVVEKSSGEVASETIQKLAIASSDTKVNFTDMKQVLFYLMQNLKIEFEIRESNHESFIAGRQAEIIINKKKAGIFGEVNPKVLVSWGIEIPTVALELDLTGIL